MIRLADKQQLIALFLDDQAAFPTRGRFLRSRLLSQGAPARRRGSQASLGRPRYYALQELGQSSAFLPASLRVAAPFSAALPDLHLPSLFLQTLPAPGNADRQAFPPRNKSAPMARPLRSISSVHPTTCAPLSKRTWLRQFHQHSSSDPRCWKAVHPRPSPCALSPS